MNLDRDRYETYLMMYAKIGSSFGRRRLPRVRRCAGHRRWWVKVAGPYKTMRKARRVAKRLRDEKTYEGTLGFWVEEKISGRKTRDWWVSEFISRGHSKNVVDALRAERVCDDLGIDFEVFKDTLKRSPLSIRELTDRLLAYSDVLER